MIFTLKTLVMINPLTYILWCLR